MSNKIMGKVRMLSMGSTTIYQDFHKMEFHDYVNNAIASVRPKDITVYARGNNHGYDNITNTIGSDLI